MKPLDKSDAAIRNEAVAWLARHDGGMSAQEREEFRRWCEADPRHAEAVDAIEAVWAALDQPRASGNADLVRRELRVLRRRRWQRRTAAVAAGLAACLAVATIWMKPPRSHRAVAIATPPTARVIAPERRTLPDGSVVELNSGSEIALAFDAKLRRVSLLRGDAHFEVAKDARHPFVVTAGGVEVKAVGTAFAVHLAPEDVEVFVTEGRVAVDAAAVEAKKGTGEGEPAGSGLQLKSMVAAGHGIVVPTTTPARMTVAPLTAREMEARLAWRRPRLEFTDTSLAEAAILFNAENRVQLKIEDDTAAALRVTGVFRADNVDGFVTLMASSFDLQAERRSKYEIILRGGLSRGSRR